MSRGICPVCDEGIKSSQTIGRLKHSCDECYPVYRRAVNLLAAAKSRSKRFSLECDLDLKWIIEHLKKPCPIMGSKFALNYSGKNYLDRHPLCPSIDKIDPLRGYLKDNCRIVSWWYNCMKQRYTDEVVYNLCSLFVQVQNDKAKISENRSTMSVW